MQAKAGAQISKRAFVQSALILFVLMLAGGLLTRLVQPGAYVRDTVDGRQVILPDSYAPYPEGAVQYPIWRWFTAPLEVLGGADGTTIIVIIVFLMLVGVAFAVMDKSGILQAALGRIVERFGDRKYTLLLVISLFFMLLGAFFGIFEEVVPLVPLMIALSYMLGWDALVGLGMSILATNLGFSAALTNPFTIGIAQRLAGLPLFSGTWLRIPIFITVYAVLAFFLTRYARKIERKPDASPVYREDVQERSKYAHVSFSAGGKNQRGALIWLSIFLLLVLSVLVASPLVPGLSGISLPLVGLLFFIGGLGAGRLAASWRLVWVAVKEGALGIAPAIPLILMAASVKHIVATGGILDTILYRASGVFSQASPFVASLAIYFLALVIEFFIGSASAKAFLLMPILMPLADLLGVTRQTAVLAYCFGDGFSNMAYPTNPVLLISLGLTVVSYPKWMRWTLGLWAWVLVVTVLFLGIGVAIHYGPF